MRGYLGGLLTKVWPGHPVVMVNKDGNYLILHNDSIYVINGVTSQHYHVTLIHITQDI